MWKTKKTLKSIWSCWEGFQQPIASNFPNNPIPINKSPSIEKVNHHPSSGIFENNEKLTPTTKINLLFSKFQSPPPLAFKFQPHCFLTSSHSRNVYTTLDPVDSAFIAQSWPSVLPTFEMATRDHHHSMRHAKWRGTNPTMTEKIQTFFSQ